MDLCATNGASIPSRVPIVRDGARSGSRDGHAVAAQAGRGEPGRPDGIPVRARDDAGGVDLADRERAVSALRFGVDELRKNIGEIADLVAPGREALQRGDQDGAPAAREDRAA